MASPGVFSYIHIMRKMMKLLLAFFAIAALPGAVYADSSTPGQNGCRIIVPRVGSLDPNVYPPVSRESTPGICPLPQRREILPSPGTGYGTPGSPMVSPGQRIPGKIQDVK